MFDQFIEWLFKTINIFGFEVPVWALVLAFLFALILITYRSPVSHPTRRYQTRRYSVSRRPLSYEDEY